ncbi:hypothetical protein JCM3774_005256 [Rhodotorula dairenensis]
MPPRDRLSGLPTELLDKIFDESWSTGPPSGPINRALCAFHDRYAWRSIRIDSTARLRRFFAITNTRAWVGLLCQKLQVQLQPDELDGGAFLALVGRTPNLKELVVGDVSDAVCDLILTGPKLRSSFPAHLRKLGVRCSTGERKDPYHPSNWSSLLVDLASLRHLALDLCSANTPTRPIKSKQELPSWPGVQDFEIALPKTGSLSAPQLIACSPNLRRLNISSKHPLPDFAGALGAVQDLSALQELVLIGNPQKGWTLPAELQQLTSLQRLKLVGQWQHLTFADVVSLCDLPLRFFELGSKSDFPLQPFFEALHMGKLPNLEGLRFDNLTCKVGYHVYEDELPWKWEEQIALFRKTMESWTTAKWTNAFPLETFRALQIMCHERGIELSGTIGRALYVEDELESMDFEIDEVYAKISERGTGYRDYYHYDRWY